MFKIKFKETRRPVSKLNDLLSVYGVDTPNILDEKGLEEWANEIATDDKFAHLRPTDRSPMTVDYLKKLFPAWTEIYMFETDLYFGRTPEKTMKGLASFVNKHTDLIEYIKGAETLIERGEIEETYHEVLRSLEKPAEERKKLPKDKQTDDSLQSGLMLCKSWGDTPFWVAFGAVKSPRFMKKKIYEEDIYNDLYKTKDGYAVLLLPLLNLGKPDHTNEIFEAAWDMSLREHPAYFNTLIYDSVYMHVPTVVNSMAEYYTREELNERLEDVRQRIIGFNYHNNTSGEIVERNGKKFVEGTNFCHLYQRSKEKRAWDLLISAIAVQEGELVKY